jgi:hypothetical protein
VQRDELDSEAVEFGECVDQLPDAPSEAVVSINHYCIDSDSSAITEQLVQPWTVFFGADVPPGLSSVSV